MALTEAQAAASGARHADNELLRLTRRRGPARHARRAMPPIAFGQT
jgi:hypothetical protein